MKRLCTIGAVSLPTGGARYHTKARMSRRKVIEYQTKDSLLIMVGSGLYNGVMESIIQNVKDIDSDKRAWLEATVGHHLQDNQRVMISVLNVEPDEETRRAGLKKAAEIAARGRAHATAQGITEEEAGVAIDEAISHYRSQKRQQTQQ